MVISAHQIWRSLHWCIRSRLALWVQTDVVARASSNGELPRTRNIATGFLSRPSWSARDFRANGWQVGGLLLGAAVEVTSWKLTTSLSAGTVFKWASAQKASWRGGYWPRLTNERCLLVCKSSLQAQFEIPVLCLRHTAEKAFGAGGIADERFCMYCHSGQTGANHRSNLPRCQTFGQMRSRDKSAGSVDIKTAGRSYDSRRPYPRKVEHDFWNSTYDQR